jgi:flagellar biosynthesis protein FlhF
VADELHETYRKLVENAVASDTAQQLVARVREELGEEQLRDRNVVRACLARRIEAMLPVAGPIRPARTGEPRLIALVGPTGVGKTTTIAKLAANLRLREHLAVGLITIDTYRIAAVEQLKTYARIIDVPIEVAMTPRQLEDAVARMGDQDVILIDTAGRSQRDEAKINELRRFFDAVQPDEVHLVLSSACSEKALFDTVRRFRPLDINRVIFTKLDEAIGFGVMLACLQRAEAGLSYVTTGQDVPDDIQVGERKALAQLILGGQARYADPDAVAAPGLEGRGASGRRWGDSSPHRSEGMAES